MKHLLAILFVLFIFQIEAQNTKNKKLINFMAVCDENGLFENHYRINNRIVQECLSNNILSLSIDVYGNCSISDTSWVEYTNDTLFIWTGPIAKKYNDGLLIISECDCDCYFHLYYDIMNFDSTPKTIILNKKELTVSNKKYLPEEYKIINGKEYLVFDSNGNCYEYEFHNNQKIKIIRKFTGQLFQAFIFDENENLIEIYYDNRVLENGKRKSIEL